MYSGYKENTGLIINVKKKRTKQTVNAISPLLFIRDTKLPQLKLQNQAWLSNSSYKSADLVTPKFYCGRFELIRRLRKKRKLKHLASSYLVTALSRT